MYDDPEVDLLILKYLESIRRENGGILKEVASRIRHD